MFEKDSINNQMIMLLKESGGNFRFSKETLCQCTCQTNNVTVSAEWENV